MTIYLFFAITSRFSIEIPSNNRMYSLIQFVTVMVSIKLYRQKH